MSKEEVNKYLSILNRNSGNKYMDSTLISAIKESPMRLYVLEKWERKVFHAQHKAYDQLKTPKPHFLILSFEEPSDLLCIGIDSKIMWGCTYQLTLQLARECEEIVIGAYPSNMCKHSWSGWNEVFLDRLFPRKDWSQGNIFSFYIYKQIW